MIIISFKVHVLYNQLTLTKKLLQISWFMEVNESIGAGQLTIFHEGRFKYYIALIQRYWISQLGK